MYRASPTRRAGGTCLYVPRGATLPDLCVKCASPDVRTLHPVRLPSRAVVALPLCPRCIARLDSADAITGGLAVALALGGIGALAARNGGAAVGVVVLLVAWIAALVFVVERVRLRVRENAAGVVVEGLRPEVVDAIARFVR